MAKQTGTHPNGENNGTIATTLGGTSGTNNPGTNAITNSNKGDSKTSENNSN